MTPREHEPNTSAAMLSGGVITPVQIPAGFTLTHGAPGIRYWKTARVGSPGEIKWGLRRMLARAGWNEYVYARRSRLHRIGNDAMKLAMRPKETATPTDVMKREGGGQ